MSYSYIQCRTTLFYFLNVSYYDYENKFNGSHCNILFNKVLHLKNGHKNLKRYILNERLGLFAKSYYYFWKDKIIVSKPILRVMVRSSSKWLTDRRIEQSYFLCILRFVLWKQSANLLIVECTDLSFCIYVACRLEVIYCLVIISMNSKSEIDEASR